jgi:hypothetical protein
MSSRNLSNDAYNFNHKDIDYWRGVLHVTRTLFFLTIALISIYTVSRVRILEMSLHLCCVSNKGKIGSTNHISVVADLAAQIILVQ